MSKKKEDKYYYEPWKDSKAWKSKAQFFSYLRGSIRYIWNRYPLKIDFKNANTIPNFEGSGVIHRAVKKVGKCEVCDNWFAAGHLQIDHRVPAGTIRDWETAAQFLHNMMCDQSNMRLCCEDCHSKISYAERMGLSLEDAIVEKQVIAFAKLPVNEQIEKLQAVGAEIKDISNQAKRKDYYREYLKRNNE